MLLTHELYQAYHSVRCLPPGMRAPFAVRPPSAACRCARCAAISTPASHRAHWLAAHARTSGGPAHAPARPSPCAGLCTDLRRQLSRTGLAWRHTAGRTSTATVDGFRRDTTARAARGPRTARHPYHRTCVRLHLMCGGICETAQGTAGGRAGRGRAPAACSRAVPPANALSRRLPSPPFP